MALNVSVHLRGGPNKTNMRSEALAHGLERLGHRVSYHGREEGPHEGADLVVQTGFAASNALVEGIDRGIPFLIMEAPFWRHIDVHQNSSFNYNGLAGGGWGPAAPDIERPHPPLQPMKEGGDIIIFGQKPTDHSLRGSDHVEWILSKQSQFPDAEFRPHPLMVSAGDMETVESVLGRCGKAVTFSSTIGAEALIAGCESKPDSPGSIAFGVRDRASWIHHLSWRQGPNSDFASNDGFIQHIVDGYDEARARFLAGQYETPRGKVDGRQVCEYYYRALPDPHGEGAPR